MKPRSAVIVCAVLGLLGATSGPALAQKSVAELLGRPATPESQPKTYREELMLWGYVENSYVFNLGDAGRYRTNALRFYDADEGYTFNAAEISLRKDSTEPHPFGFGLVVTGGVDSQKNHSLGIFRSLDDGPPNFRNTPEIDLAEAYVSYRIPVGEGLTLKAGKWATLIGYEVYENPKNLNVSRSFLYTLGTPYFHTGLLASYPVASWLTVTAGFTNGWDNADNNNGYLRPTGSFAFTPTKTLTASVNWLVGPEQNRNLDNGRHNTRYVVDNTIIYTGIDKLTLAVNFDIAGEEREPTLVAAGVTDTHASWGGIAGYASYQWTEPFRTALRFGYFKDADGVRNGVRPAGQSLNLFELTATAEYKIWRGLMARLEYRHDAADHKAFNVRNPGPAPTSSTQDTITIALYYVFP
jgi:Putative beta-barrel porin-2, OmpL-like. bbp2